MLSARYPGEDFAECRCGDSFHKLIHESLPVGEFVFEHLASHSLLRRLKKFFNRNDQRGFFELPAKHFQRILGGPPGKPIFRFGLRNLAPFISVDG